MSKLIPYCFVFYLAIAVLGCTNLNHSDGEGKQLPSLKAVDKRTLVVMVKQLHDALNVKDYSVKKGLQVFDRYLSAYKICIPGFSNTIPYDASYLYVYCIYETKHTPPTVLSFNFKLTDHLQQQLSLNEIKSQFNTWRKEDSMTDIDGITSTSYNAGSNNLLIQIKKKALSSNRDSVITDITVLR